MGILLYVQELLMIQQEERRANIKQFMIKRLLLQIPMPQ